MAEQSFPFENIDTTESQFSEWATNFQETGVQGSPTGTELGITVTGSDLNLTVASGQAFIRGHYYINTDDLVLAVTSAGTNTRIDIVVVELDPEANTIVTKIVSGTAVASDPVAPTLTQSATGIYQLPIATLTIPNSTVVITSGMLVDTRTFMGNRIGIWTTATRPANPTAYQTLGYNTTLEYHESWNGTGWVGFFDPISTEGDLVVGDGTGQASRLGIGTDDQVLTVVSGVPEWADGGGGGNYYNITAAGTYTVDLAAGLYFVVSSLPVTVGGLSVEAPVLHNYASDITSIVAPEGGTTWTARTSGFGTDRILGLAYGDGLFVAVGYDGVMTTSTDGISWTSRTSGFGTTRIYAAAYGDGLYLAGGSSSTMTTSTDGVSWTSRTSGLPVHTTIIYGDGLYLAQWGRDISTSTNGTSWTLQEDVNSNYLYSLAYGDGLYLAAGTDGDMISSTNGTAWNSRSSGMSGNILALSYGNGLYLAGSNSGELSTSTDGTSWTSRTSGFGTTAIQAITYSDGIFVAVGEDGKLTTSTDGTTWTTRTSGFGTTDIFGVTYGDGLYVAGGGGYNGKLTTSPGFVSIQLALEPKSPITTLS